MSSVLLRLPGIRARYRLAMVDDCQVLAYTPVQSGVSGAVTGSFAGETETPCLFTPLSAEERHQAEGTQAVVVAQLRLPPGTRVTHRDRVRITKRFGAALVPPLEFAVEGSPREIAGCLLCDVREVTR